jgi:hypothetical protein
MMEKRNYAPTAAKVAAAGLGLGVVSYAAYAAATWASYGRRKRRTREGESLLDAFMPDPEVAIRHARRVNAPADVTFDVACRSDIGASPIVKALFKTRELIVGRPPETIVPTGTLVEQLRAFGWVILAEVPGREIVFGAVTQPWRADATFRSVAPDDFASFNEAGYVKIAWTLRTDPAGPLACTVRSDTRVATTDDASRRTFRRYWAAFLPGIKLIRVVMLQHIKWAAEQEAADAALDLSGD